MATPTTHSPFASVPPTPAQLQAYAEGHLSPAEQHAVEQALEADPLLRDALEGLRQPNAVTGWTALQQHRPATAGPARYWLGGGVLLLIILAVVRWSVDEPLDPRTTADHGVSNTPISGPATPTTETPLATAEIARSTELPTAQQIGHRSDERHVMPLEKSAPLDRTTDVTPLADRTPDSAQLTARNSTAAPLHATRPSRQLLYLHDLKLVHPNELYAREPILTVDPGGLDARFADRDQQQQAQGDSRHMVYTAFMDETLARFARTDHKGSLTELRFLLTQYPDDVNALFYAGLCTYNLGLYDRARAFLHRAATHPVAVFDEEATWYHALTLKRLGEREAANEAFARIASGGGYYAERAVSEQARR